jgi:hypothetical protein
MVKKTLTSLGNHKLQKNIEEINELRHTGIVFNL